MIGISGSVIWSKTLMELIFNPCAEFRWSPEDPVSQIHSPQLHVAAPGIFSDLLRFVQMLKREWVRKTGSNRTYLSIVKLQPRFLSLQWKTCLRERTVVFLPDFAVKDLPLDKTLNNNNIVFCPRAGPSLQTQAPRLQFCPKKGLPLQIQEPRLQFYYG